jgi:outer membrane protein TolC
MKSIFFTFIICFIRFYASAQLLSVEDCYKAARQNYPLVKQLELISKSTSYSIENAVKGYFPQVSVNGQISYQTDVTKIPVQLPGMNIPEMDKDQYRIFAEANQILYDGGAIKLQQKLAKVNGAIETQKLEVELYKLQERINQLFFGVLFITEQLEQNDLIKKDIQLGIDKANTAVANGTALKSSVNVLKAELLKVEQRGIEQRYSRKGFLDMLSLFINKTLPENVKLLKPDVKLLKPEAEPAFAEIDRPELKLYQEQLSGLDEQERSIVVKNRPKFSAFLQGGLGKPALNMLSTSTEPFAIGGLKMSWPLSGLYTLKKEKAIVDVNRKSIGLQKETFLLNTNIQLKQQDAELQKLRELMSSDEEIIALRASVKKVSALQLENGAINTSDYLRDVNAEDQARQMRLLHEIQLIIAQHNKQNTTGIKY